jgi:hypothetical protein
MQCLKATKRETLSSRLTDDRRNRAIMVVSIGRLGLLLSTLHVVSEINTAQTTATAKMAVRELITTNSSKPSYWPIGACGTLLWR